MPQSYRRPSLYPSSRGRASDLGGSLYADADDPSGKSYEDFSLTPSRNIWGRTRFIDDYNDDLDFRSAFETQKARNESYADAYRMAASRRASPDYGVNAKPENFGTTLAKGAAGAALSAGTTWLVTAGFAAI